LRGFAVEAVGDEEGDELAEHSGVVRVDREEGGEGGGGLERGREKVQQAKEAVRAMGRTRPVLPDILRRTARSHIESTSSLSPLMA
jgi:hypothetical protein